MADATYKELKLKQQNTTQKILSRKRAVQTYKDIVEDPDTSDKDRKKYKEQYDAAVQELKDLEEESSTLKKDINKVLGATVVTQVEKEYDALKKELDVQLDPDSERSKNIKKKIDALVPKYQEAYSKSVGTRVSKSVAKGKLTNAGSATFGIPAAEGETSAQTPAPTLEKTPQKTPEQTPQQTPGQTSEQAPTDNQKKKQAKPKLDKTIYEPTFTTGDAPAGYVEKPAAGKESAGLNAAAALDLTSTVFKNVPSLMNLLDQYVKKGWSNDRFLQELRDDVWYKKNSKEVKARYVQLYNYRDLVATGQADGSTDYEKQIATLERKLADKARSIGSGAANDPAALRRAAENMYITNVGIDDAMTTDFLASAIRPISSMIAGKPTMGYSGEALTNYKTILKTARDNGFEISDILPGGANEQQVLEGIATGRIDINRVQQDARKLAAQGQPQYVRDLLSQGYDLSQVFAPYRKVMGTVLEINPDEVDLNDPLLRTAITDKGDMNLYDFKKALRQDNRWQYTEQAKADVSQAAFNVLKDFGFQG
jgi:hypothetical protein